MIEPAVVALRLSQYAGAAILMGSSLFFIYALPRTGDGAAATAPWARPLLVAGGVTLALAALSSISAQSALLAGSIAEGLKAETLTAVAAGMDFGRASLARASVAALATAAVLALRPGRTTWAIVAGLGVIAVASFPWMGHGATSEGAARIPHLVADLLHSLAAAAWIGALAAFVALLGGRPGTRASVTTLYRALHGFSGVGTLLVAVVIASGLVNSWVLVGPDRLDALWTTSYGRLLALKLLLVIVMLGLASANRYRLTPRLAASLANPSAQGPALAALRRSIQVETGLGIAVLALVAWFGTMPPPAVM